MKSNMELNELFYGNLTYTQNKESKDIIPNYNAIVKKYTSNKYIYPNMDKSKAEVEFLKKNLTTDLLEDENHRHLSQDYDLFEYLKQANKQMGFNDDVYDLIEPVLLKVINPLVVNLKKEWNRARPFQYAYELGIDFHPLATVSGNSPSYPSGHTMQAEAWAKIMKHNYPDFSERIDLICNDISQSRINMGVHFPSDIEFGKNIIDFLWQHNLLNKQ